MKFTKLFTLSCALAVGAALPAQRGPVDPPRGPHRLPPAFEVPDELQGLADELAAARDALEASRQEVIDALGEDVDRDAIQTAVDAWREANAEQIEAARVLAQELRASIRELGPEEYERPEREPLPEEVVALREEAKTINEALRASRVALLESLGEDLTREEREAALDAWREENAEELARLDEIRDEVRTYLRENRPDRGDRPGASEEAHARREAMRAMSEEMRAARETLRTALEAAETEEERQALIQAFREEWQDEMQERKNLRRLELIGGGSGGDRRPGG
jgi:hypothetical protein